MKYIYKPIVIIFVWLFLINCRPPQDIQPTVDAELKPYYDSFITEALSHGYSADYLKNNATIKFGYVDAAHAGITYYQTNTIVIDSVYWRNYKNYPNLKEFIMFHELGHLLLKRDHDYGVLSNGEFKSVMFSYDNNPSPNSIYYWGIRRKYYIDELFNSNIALPEWAKKEYDPFPLASSNRQLVAAQEFSQSVALTNYLNTLPNAQCQIIENNSLLNVKTAKFLGFTFTNYNVMNMAGLSQDKIDLMSKSTNYEIEVKYRLKSGTIRNLFSNGNDQTGLTNFWITAYDNEKIRVAASAKFSLLFPEPPILANPNFNVVRLVRQGSFFAFYMNNKLVHYSDMLATTLPENLVYLITSEDGNTEFNLDYFRIYQR